MDDSTVDLIFAGSLESLPPVSSKIVRIFTSSTFTDTTMERNTLMAKCYPRIKDYCREKHGLEFQVVDMRWGVRDEATDDHMTTELCMKEIENCQRLSMGPNFVVFLGQKYGYRPIPTYILSSELQMLSDELTAMGIDKILLDTWYKKDSNAVPPISVLQPISSILINFNNKRVPKLQAEDQAVWWDTLNKMQKLLRKAAASLHAAGKFDKDITHNYFMSVTEREVINGVLSVKNTKNHCLAYVRYINNINLQNLKKASLFVDIINRSLDTESSKLLGNLRDVRLPNKIESTNMQKYTVEWIGREGLDTETHDEYLNHFISHFYKNIVKLVDRAMRKEDSSAQGQIVTEILQHLHACNNSVKVFYGREESLQRIEEYMSNDSDKPLVLYGEGGCGKTSLLAKSASLSLTKWFKHCKPISVVRFLGTTPDSSALTPTLISICQQISYNFMLPFENIPDDIVPLTAHFKQLLTNASPAQPLFFFLDSVDQLTGTQNEISWLPTRLPPNCKIILSCANQDSNPSVSKVYHMLRRLIDIDENFIEVTALGEDLAMNIIKMWMKTACRDLNNYQWRQVANAISKCSLPIFVKLVFAEICRWRSYTRPQETHLASTVMDSIMMLFERIEKQHGRILVFHALAYITAAKSGLSESELEDLISLDDRVLDDVYQYHLPPVRRIPPLLWTRIRNDLPNYLSEREADGVNVMNWYHRQFRDTAKERYFKNMNMATYFHSSIADYYLGIWGGGKPKPFKFTEIQRHRFGLTDKEGSADRKVPNMPLAFTTAAGAVARYNLRKFGELPYHLVRSRRLTDLYEHVLFNYDWLHAKLSSCPLQAVLADFEDSSQYTDNKDSKRELMLVADALRLGGAILAIYPNMLAPQLIGRLLPEIGNNPNIRMLLQACDKNGPKHCSIIPLNHCLHTPGGPLKSYPWNEEERGLILSSLYWGYVISPFLAGILAKMFGAKYPLLLAILGAAILTMCTSVIVPNGWEWLCVSRFFQGIAQGFSFPCVHTILAKWIHPSERGLIPVTFSGTILGSALMLGVSGVIAASSIGWPGIFYVSGGLCIIWSILWLIYCSNSPAECSNISKDEKEFLETIPGNTHKNLSIPWRHILKSKPFWAILAAQCTQNWLFVTLLSNIPSYIDGVLDFPISSNALLSSLPYIVMLIMIYVYSFIGDYFIKHHNITVTVIRKASNTIAFWAPMLCLIILGNITNDIYTAITLLTIGLGLNAGINSGYLVNHIDIAPNFAGPLMGLCHGIGNILSIVGPMFVGYAVYDVHDPALWNIAFSTTGAISFVGGLIYLIFASGNIQPWNNLSDYSLEGHQFAVFGFALTNDLRYIVSISTRFITWDLSTSDLTRDVNPGIDGIMQQLVLSPDNKWAAAYTNNNQTVLLNMLSNEFVIIDNPFENDFVTGLYLLNQNLFVNSKRKIARFDMRGKHLDQIDEETVEEKWEILLTKIEDKENYHIVYWSGLISETKLCLYTAKTGYTSQPIHFHSVITFTSDWSNIYCCSNDNNYQIFKYSFDLNENTSTGSWTEVQPLPRYIDDEKEILLQVKMGKQDTLLLGTTRKGFVIWDLENQIGEEVMYLPLPHGVRNITTKMMTSNSVMVGATLSYAVAGVRKNLYVWCLKSKQLMKVLDAHFGRIIQLEALTIGNWNSVITSSIDRSVKIWNINNIFEQVHVIDRHELLINNISLSETGLAATVTRSCVGIWELRSGRLLSKLADSHLGAIVTHAEITPDGKFIVSAETGKLLIWNRVSEQVLFRHDQPGILQIKIFENGEKVLSISCANMTVETAAGDDGQGLVAVAHVRNLNDGVIQFSFDFAFRIIPGVAFRNAIITADEANFVVVSVDKAMKDCVSVFSASNGSFLHKISLKGCNIKEVLSLVPFPHKASQIAIITSERGSIMDIKSKKHVRSIMKWSGKCTRDGKFGLYAPTRGGLELLELRKGTTVKTFIPKVAEGVFTVICLFTEGDKYVLYYHSGRKTLRVFRTSDAQMIANYRMQAELTAIKSTTDGKGLVLGTVDGCLSVLAIADPENEDNYKYLQELPSRDKEWKRKLARIKARIKFKAVIRASVICVSFARSCELNNRKMKENCGS